MEHPQTFSGVQQLTSGAKVRQVAGDITNGAAEKAPGLLVVLSVRGQSDVALLHHTAGLPSDLVQEHLVVFLAVAVQMILMHGQQGGSGEVLAVHAPVVNGDLGGGPSIQSVEQLGVAQEHLGLVRLAGNGVVDVREAHRLRELAAKLEGAVLPEPLNGDGLLDGFGQLHFHLLLLLGYLECFNQGLAPPLDCRPPVPWRRDFRIYTQAAWDIAVLSG